MCLMCDCLTSLESNPHKHESSNSRFWFKPLRHYHLLTASVWVSSGHSSFSTVQKYEKADWRL